MFCNKDNNYQVRNNLLLQERSDYVTNVESLQKIENDVLEKNEKESCSSIKRCYF